MGDEHRRCPPLPFLTSPLPEQSESCAVPPWPLRALAGLLAAFSALAVAQLVAAFINDAAAPVVVVGGVAIDSTPEWLKAFAINNFGTHDKDVLVGGILATLAVYAAVAGMLAFRHLLVGVVAVAGFGVLGVLAGLSRPESSLSWALPSLLGALAGVGALVLMVRLSRRPDGGRAGGRRSAVRWTHRGTVAVSCSVALVLASPRWPQAVWARRSSPGPTSRRAARTYGSRRPPTRPSR